MSLALITQPAFLHKHFSYTRQGLLGQWSHKVVNTIEALPEIETVLSPSAVKAERFEPILEPTTIYHPGKMDQFPQVIEVVPAPVQASVVTNTQETKVLSREKPASWIKSIARFTLTVVMVISLSVGAILILPEIYYTVFSQNTAVGEVATAAKVESQTKPIITPEPEPYMPPKNPDLPTGAWLSIPRIGVYSEMHATLDENEALDKGIWLVPDFGRPGDTTQPIIAAAHRFGWDWWWQSDYWKYNSFYLLTETEPGDRVEIIYDQRKWVYEIYAGEEGELITDYDADLILYTCKYLNSPVRYFRYAKLVKE